MTIGLSKDLGKNPLWSLHKHAQENDSNKPQILNFLGCQIDSSVEYDIQLCVINLEIYATLMIHALNNFINKKTSGMQSFLSLFLSVTVESHNQCIIMGMVKIIECI